MNNGCLLYERHVEDLKEYDTSNCDVRSKDANLDTVKTNLQENDNCIICKLDIVDW